MFYKPKDEKSKDESKDKEGVENKNVAEKELFVLDIETLSKDLQKLEILKETDHKIVSEDVIQPALINTVKVAKIVQRRLSRNPITENPEQPLEACYKPSVPVVQVSLVNMMKTTNTL